MIYTLPHYKWIATTKIVTFFLIGRLQFQRRGKVTHSLPEYFINYLYVNFSDKTRYFFEHFIFFNSKKIIFEMCHFSCAPTYMVVFDNLRKLIHDRSSSPLGLSQLPFRIACLFGPWVRFPRSWTSKLYISNNIFDSGFKFIFSQKFWRNTSGEYPI